jgi:hypothetical protein
MSKVFEYVDKTRRYRIGGWKEELLKLIETSNLDELSYEQKIDVLDQVAIKIKDNCQTLYSLIKQFDLQDKKEEILYYIQGRSPQLICPDNPKYKSKRAKLSKKYVRAFGKSTIMKKSKDGIILNQYIDTNDCFCLIHKSGIYQNTYIPVIRYGVDDKVGF